MTPSTNLEVATDQVLSIRFGRNSGDAAAAIELAAQAIVVEGFVREESADGELNASFPRRESL